MNYSERGIPILAQKDKLEALEYTLDGEHWEDAAGHLCDLLAFVTAKMNAGGRKKLSLVQVVKYYGGFPTPVEG